VQYALYMYCGTIIITTRSDHFSFSFTFNFAFNPRDFYTRGYKKNLNLKKINKNNNNNNSFG